MVSPGFVQTVKVMESLRVTWYCSERTFVTHTHKRLATASITGEIAHLMSLLLLILMANKV